MPITQESVEIAAHADVAFLVWEINRLEKLDFSTMPVDARSPIQDARDRFVLRLKDQLTYRQGLLKGFKS